MSFKLQGNTDTIFQIETSIKDQPLLGVVLSGVGYTYRNPLLYYSAKIIKQTGLDYIGIDYQYYLDKSFFALSENEQEERWENDNNSVVQSILNIESNYKGIILIGKSMGTSVIRRLIKNKAIMDKAICILLTPGNEWKELCDEIKNIKRPVLIIGSRDDKYYGQVDNHKLSENAFVKVYELQKGDHSLEINDIEKDLETLRNVIIQMKMFIEDKIKEFG